MRQRGEYAHALSNKELIKTERTGIIKSGQSRKQDVYYFTGSFSDGTLVKITNVNYEWQNGKLYNNYIITWKYLGSVMTKREEYAISFRRMKTSYGYFNFTETTSLENEQIAMHIQNSEKREAEMQIEALEKALNNEKIQEDWGEVMGSQSDIYVQRGTVQIAYTNREIPIQDFKQLLEEWLAFINS